MISYNDILYFTELTQTLNFSRASERIGISQPSLSAAIKRLEHFIGVELFIRDKHKVLLTQAGKNLQLHSQQLLELWDTIKSSCLISQTEVQGSLSLGCHSSIALYLLPKFLSHVLEKYPRLEIKLKHDLSRNITEEVINQTIDIGIVVNPIKHPDLIIKKILEDEITCWQAKKINNQKVIICDPNLHQTQWILKKMKEVGINYTRVITTSSLEVIANLTVVGTGIGILPTRVFQSFSNEMIEKHSRAPAFHDVICLIYRHENRNTKAVKEIVKEIQALITKK